ncbi:GNAT family N-acetyltransferase [Ignatzschineria larvae DSM 13226]|uniref:GNAT family N-acetyltransferase n=1 Tax=Ignatzschineria larvae DSM 13226 TaxID=1111732 RepID=A0ABZ3C3I3_9GAMM|nr:GNAT family N-acetyltransferase [Ignatzschineria larvae]
MDTDYFLYISADDPRAEVLTKALLNEYDSRYGTFFDPRGAIAEMERYPTTDFAPPLGNFILLMRNQTVIGGGGFKFYDSKTAEIKRVWVDEDYRRQGLAEKILQELEVQAARQGYKRIYLTTGCRQPEAVGLYLKNGYLNLFDLKENLEALKKLPFEKLI